jgi:TRAP-type C4-dicarboxylate transport system substrate-binding protein
MHVHAGQAIQMASKLVRTPDDTQGLKLRVPGPTGNSVVEAMGATPVTMPVPDLPQALSTNAVDGALIPWEIIPALQLWETTEYQIEGPDNNRFGTTTFQVSMNKQRYESMPEDIRAVFDKHCGEDWLREAGDIWRGIDDHGIKLATDNGNEHVVLTQEEMDAFNTALAPVVDQWIEAQSGFDAAALVEAAKKAIAARKS